MSAKWRRAIRREQWQDWENTFLKVDRNTALKRIRVSAKRKAAVTLPEIQGIGSFQGKCEFLKEVFFPANVATPARCQPAL